MAKFSSQRQAKEIIQASIDTNDRAVYRALVVINDLQTAEEQGSRQTICANGVGFSKFDAEMLSRLVAYYHQDGRLSRNNLILARQKIRRYWKQLAVHSGGLPPSQVNL